MKTVYIHKPVITLPNEGWLQACVVCDEITGNTHQVIRVADINYIAYLCARCEIKILNKTTLHKNKFFRRVNRTIISHLRHNNIYNYSIGDVVNTSFNHTQLTYILRQRYLPVEPNPPAPLAVSSSSSTNSTRENGDKSGVQI